jgi:hypothetical protein
VWILYFAGNFRELCELLSKSTEVLMKNGQHLDNVLETLDLQQHSLGVLAVLCVKFSLPAPSATPDHHELLFAQAQEFITGCNGEQVRFAPDTCKPTSVFEEFSFCGFVMCGSFTVPIAVCVIIID